MLEAIGSHCHELTSLYIEHDREWTGATRVESEGAPCSFSGRGLLHVARGCPQLQVRGCGREPGMGVVCNIRPD